MQEKEVWKQIGADSRYLISTLGRVMSLKCNRCKTLKPANNTKGYPAVNISIDGNLKMMPIHRMVAKAFIPNPKNKRTVNHKNGIKSDNRLENLEWMTYSENHKHAYDVLGRKRCGFGITVFNYQTSGKVVAQIDKSGREINIFKSCFEAMRNTGVDHSSISKCARGESFTAGKYRWKYR